MKRIDPQTVQRIIDTADIVEVVADFVQLKRRGANYMGLCPFHNERTPSFSVNRARGICKCFSCGEGGNVVNFVMKIRQCGYGDALRYLAQKYNIEIKEAELTDRELQQRRERDSIFATLEAAARFFESSRSTPRGTAALAGRITSTAITPEQMNQACVGYAPPRTEDLAEALAPEGFTTASLAAAGLTAENSGGIFSDVITVGVRNRYGRIAGFMGFNADGSPSASAMPPTLVWQPDETLAGLWEGRGAIAKSGFAIVAPNPLLLLWLYQSGMTNAIGLTAPGWPDGRIKQLRKLTSEVILLLPSDKRDIFDTLRQALPLLQEEFSVKVAAIPGHTPLPDYAATHTSAQVTETIVDRAIDMVIYRINTLRRTTPQSGAYRMLFDDIIVTLRCVKSPLLLEAYLNELSDATGRPVAALLRGL